MANSLRTWLLPLLLCVSWSVVLFRLQPYGLEGALYEDHKVLMNQRSLVSSEGEFLWRLVSFDRLRPDGSSFLFRPLLGVYQGVVDILWRDYPFAAGMTSIVLHGLCGLVFYLLLRAISTGWLAALGTFVFLTHFAGSSIVTWRHVSGYILSVMLFGLGLLEIVKADSQERTIRLGRLVSLFLLASFFHEGVALMLLLFPPLLYFSGVGKSSPLDRRALFFLFGTGCLYFVVSAVDLVLLAPSGGIFGQHMPYRPGGLSFALFGRAFLGVLYVIGNFLASFLVPQVITLPWDAQKPLFAIVGVVGLSALAYAVHRLRREPPLRGADLAVAWGVALLFSLSLGLGGVRLVEAGYYYLAHGRYYQYFANFVFIFAVVLLLSRRGWSRLGRAAKVAIVILVFNTLYFSYFRQQRIGTLVARNESESATLIRRVAVSLQEGECYAGGGSAEWDGKVPPIFLYRKSCGVRPGTPVNAVQISTRWQTPTL